MYIYYGIITAWCGPIPSCRETAIHIVFDPIAGAAIRGIRSFQIIKQFIILLTMTVKRPIEICLKSCILTTESGQRSANKKDIIIVSPRADLRNINS
jgi:hypothetical protein